MGKRSLRLLFAAVGAAMLAACGGDSDVAAQIERGNKGTSNDAGGPRVSAGTEFGEDDWTAKVRTLGDPGQDAPRALPGDTIGEGAQVVAQSGASTGVNPAVASLLDAASAQFRAGNFPRAAATLERAMAIEPDNAWLWHRLAIVRLHEGRLEQAAALAAKSSSLASADRKLLGDNWKIVAEVRRRQGDTAGAAAAQAQARKLAN